MTDEDKALVERLRDDWPEILVEKHWMMDSDAIEEQRKEAADRIEAQAAEIEKLREALGWFLNDSRFIVQVGGNPNVVPQMIEAARKALEQSTWPKLYHMRPDTLRKWGFVNMTTTIIFNLAALAWTVVGVLTDNPNERLLCYLIAAMLVSTSGIIDAIKDNK